MGPAVRAVECNIDRDIPYDPDSLPIGIPLQAAPLLLKLNLLEFIETNLV